MTELSEASNALLSILSRALPDDIEALARNGDPAAPDAARSSVIALTHDQEVSAALAEWAVDAARLLPLIAEHTWAAKAASDVLGRCATSN